MHWITFTLPAIGVQLVANVALALVAAELVDAHVLAAVVQTGALVVFLIKKIYINSG